MDDKSQTTEGATMLVVTLFTLILLAGVLTVATQLSLSARKSSTDQVALVTAQNKAESQASQAKLRIQDLQGMLSSQSVNGIKYINPPVGTSTESLEAAALTFCGNGAWVSTNEFSVPRKGEDIKKYSDAKVCAVNSDAITATNYSILGKYATAANYQNAPQYLSSSLSGIISSLGDLLSGNTTNWGNTTSPQESARTQWWKDQLSVNSSVAGAVFSIVPARVVKLDSTNFRFYFMVKNIKSTATVGNATRILASSGSNTAGDWWFQIGSPELLDKVWLVDKLNLTQTNMSGMGSNTYDGDYHANQQLRISTSATAATFLGKFSSASCTDLETTISNRTFCAQTAGYFQNSSTLVATTSTKSDFNSDLASQMKTTNPNMKLPSDIENINFLAAYIALPKNSINQAELATQNGLNLDTIPLSALGLAANAPRPNYTSVKLYAGDSSGNSLATYNAATKSWVEPSPTYQYIELVTSTGVALKLRMDASGNVQRLNNTTWVSTIINTNGNFNGVVYGSNLSKITAPSRLNSSTTDDVSKIPPALASFSKMSINSDTTIDVMNDLTMSDTPCANLTTNAGTCTKKPKNMLGVFTTKGNIRISSAAPKNITIHSALVATDGGVGLDAAPAGMGSRGKINVIGSIVIDKAQVIGDTSGNGFSWNASHDQRFKSELPPGSPHSTNWSTTDSKEMKVDMSMTKLSLRQATNY